MSRTPLRSLKRPKAKAFFATLLMSLATNAFASGDEYPDCVRKLENSETKYSLVLSCNKSPAGAEDADRLCFSIGKKTPEYYKDTTFVETFRFKSGSYGGLQSIVILNKKLKPLEDDEFTRNERTIQASSHNVSKKSGRKWVETTEVDLMSPISLKYSETEKNNRVSISEQYTCIRQK